VKTQCPSTVIQIDSEFACGKLLEICGKLVENLWKKYNKPVENSV